MATLSGMHWWALALRGVVAILFAIIAFAVPGITLAALVILFGVYALIDGIFAIVSAPMGKLATWSGGGAIMGTSFARNDRSE